MKIINKDTEKKFLEFIEKTKKSPNSWDCIHFPFSILKKENLEERRLNLLVTLAKDSFSDPEGSIFVCSDGDIFILQKKLQTASLENFLSDLKFFFKNDPLIAQKSKGNKNAFHNDYKLPADLIDLAYLCEFKLADSKGLSETIIEIPETIPQDEKIKESFAAREKRKFLTIMVVEDNDFSRELLKNSISKEHQTIVVKSGEEAMDCYLNNACNIVFLDINLPEMDGHAVLKNILSIDADAFVVMITASSAPKDVKQAIMGGAKGFVVKPFSKQNVNKYIELYKAERKNKKKVNPAKN